MRKVWLFLAAAAIAAGQSSVRLIPDCGPIFINFTAAPSNTSNFDNRSAGCTDWIVAYTNVGFTVISLVVQDAPNAAGGVAGTFVTYAGTVTSGINPNTAITQASSKFSGYFPWMRVRLASATGSGTITGVLYGFRSSASLTLSGNVTVVGPDAAGSPPTGNPVLVAGWDLTNVRRIVTDTNGRLDPAGTSTAMADGVSNTQNLPDFEGGVGGVRTFPTEFNGSTWDRRFACTNQAAITLTASGDTQIIALSGSTVIQICHLSIAAASAIDLKITRGTGANCAGATADVTGLYRNVTAVALDFDRGPLRGAAGTAICVNLSANVNAGGVVTYAQF